MVSDVTNFADATEFLTKHAKNTGADVTIAFDVNNSVLLKNMTVTTLTANQQTAFHFV